MVAAGHIAAVADAPVRAVEVAAAVPVPVVGDGCVAVIETDCVFQLEMTTVIVAAADVVETDCCVQHNMVVANSAAVVDAQTECDALLHVAADVPVVDIAVNASDTVLVAASAA